MALARGGAYATYAFLPIPDSAEKPAGKVRAIHLHLAAMDFGFISYARSEQAHRTGLTLAEAIDQAMRRRLGARASRCFNRLRRTTLYSYRALGLCDHHILIPDGLVPGRSAMMVGNAPRLTTVQPLGRLW